MDKLPCVTAKSIEILQKTLKTQKNNPLHQTSLNSPNPEKKNTHTKRRQRQIHKTLQCTISAYVCIFCMRWSTKDVFHKMQVCICLCVSVCCMAKTTTTTKKTLNMNTHVWTYVFPGSDFSICVNMAMVRCTTQSLTVAHSALSVCRVWWMIGRENN